MATLYVTEPGCRIEKEYHRLLVTNPDDEVIFSVPMVKVSDVVVIGSVGFTTQALVQLLENDVPVSILTASGKILGRLQPTSSKNIFLRHAQYQRALEADFCFEMARTLVQGKIHNQRTLAQRIGRTNAKVDRLLIDEMRDMAKATMTASGLDGLRGLEGNAAKRYFEILRKAIPAEWDFVARSRRPPRSAFNALLSLGYSLLTQNMITALEIVGLDPFDGFFHSDAYGRPALALDLVEEFRSVIVDSVVLLVVNKKILNPDDFLTGEKGAYFLKPAGMRKFLRQYARRLQTPVKHPLSDHPLTYQKIFELQARQMRKKIEGQIEQYLPFVFR